MKELKTFTMLFVPHLPPVRFTVDAESVDDAKFRAEQQTAAGKDPVFEQVSTQPFSPAHEVSHRCVPARPPRRR